MSIDVIKKEAEFRIEFHRVSNFDDYFGSGLFFTTLR
jgi:hypothetical protein